MLNLIPTVYGRFAFGIGAGILMLLAAMFVLKRWEKAIRAINADAKPDATGTITFSPVAALRRIFWPCALTVLWIAAPFLLMLGPTLGSPGPSLHAVQPVRQDFVEALHKAEEAVKPQTKQEKETEREAKQEKKRAAETETIEARDERVLDGVESFRIRMLNPDIQE